MMLRALPLKADHTYTKLWYEFISSETIAKNFSSTAAEFTEKIQHIVNTEIKNFHSHLR